MSQFDVPYVSPSTAQAIQDAILLGNTKEISGVLEGVRGDGRFPKNLWYGLEAMFYFRHYYGKGGELEPASADEKKRMFDLESFFGRELIESLGWYMSPSDLSEKAS